MIDSMAFLAFSIFDFCGGFSLPFSKKIEAIESKSAKVVKRSQTKRLILTKCLSLTVLANFEKFLIFLISSSLVYFCKYFLLNQLSFSILKIGLFLLSRSRENSRMSSSIVKSSLSPLGDQPKRARKLTRASGRYPSSMYSITDRAPCLLESFFLSGPKIGGKWINLGGFQEKA